jgi:hypothetical protein
MCLNISGSRSDGSRLLGGGTGVNKRPGTLQAELLVTQFWNPFNIAKNNVSMILYVSIERPVHRNIASSTATLLEGILRALENFAQLIQDWIHFGMPQSLLRNLVYELSVK